MIKKLLPLVFLLIGMGAGVGAGIFLRPEMVVEPEEMAFETGEYEAEKIDENDDGGTDKYQEDESGHEYVKLNNQFVVPIIADERVTALVVLALSIEVPEGATDKVYMREPKLRDSFLQVLFDHANVGGFEGNFTDAEMLGRLRMALKEVAQKDLGKEIAKDVLIVEIARQDY